MKRERIDYAKEIGKKYGKLEIKEFIFEKGKKTLAVCKCDCGGEKTTQYTNLKIGKTVSCGCVNNESRHSKENKRRTHGMTNTKIYHTYQGMKLRCYCKKNASYQNYGGRGIKVCKEWLDSETGFENFYKWALENGYNDAVDKNGRALYSIDRIDVNGDYAPANCRWVTQEVQSYNKRDNFFTMEEAQKIKEKGFNKETIKIRMKKFNLTLDEALSVPLHSYKIKNKFKL